MPAVSDEPQVPDVGEVVIKPEDPVMSAVPPTRDDAGHGERIVSIIAPCRNEHRHIDAFAGSALAQRLPAGWRLELIVADARSDDGTVDALQDAERLPTCACAASTTPAASSRPG